MSTNDIRSIAAYYGAMCSYDQFHDIGIKLGKYIDSGKINPSEKYGAWVSVTNKVDWYVLSLLAARARYFKLYLRPISSLTNAEVCECARQYGYGNITNDSVVKRSETGFFVQYLFVLSYNGILEVENETDSYITKVDGREFAQLHNYLQTIGVYVPGTIDPRFVELTT